MRASSAAAAASDSAASSSQHGEQCHEHEHQHDHQHGHQHEQQQEHHEHEQLGQQQQQLSADQQLWAEIEAVGAEAEELESRGRHEEAANLLTEATLRLETQHGPHFGLMVLQQLLWDALYACGRHEDALVVAANVHAAVSHRFGGESAELQLVSVRLGMSSAACGKLEGGLALIYEATPVLQDSLDRMVAEAEELAAADGGADPRAAGALQDTINRLGAALAEANFYGSMLTMQHAAATGRHAGVVEGWQELQAILLTGFCNLLLVAGGPQGSAVRLAVREHDRLTQAMDSEPLLARLVRSQNEWLHEIAVHGLEHPVFAQDPADS